MDRHRYGLSVWVLLLVVALAAAPPLSAQPLTRKTVNLESPETTPVGELHFPFTHRFGIFGSKVTSSPTFTLSTGLTPRTSAAIRYATSSDVNPTQPGAFNEWELSLKRMALSQSEGAWLDLSGMLAYNTAASSVDGALLASRQWGALALLGTAKAFSNGFGMGVGSALGAGLRWNLTRYLQLSADLNGVTSGGLAGSAPPAWSVGTTFEIPYSPHSVSLYVTNANTHTLEGTSRGTDTLRGGFEFLVPFTSWARWGAIFAPPGESAAPAGAQPSAPSAKATASVSVGETIVVIDAMTYGPETLTVPAGTTIHWVNRDAMAHTVTGKDGAWDSGMLQPGGTYSRRFDVPGTYPYLCTPHPFMTGTVVVTGGDAR